MTKPPNLRQGECQTPKYFKEGNVAQELHQNVTVLMSSYLLKIFSFRVKKNFLQTQILLLLELLLELLLLLLLPPFLLPLSRW